MLAVTIKYSESSQLAMKSNNNYVITVIID